MAFGNGGTFRDAAGNLVYNPPNDGRGGSWEDRLYNETYSEVIDDIDPLFGEDPGSAESGNIRPGGGAIPTDDPTGGGVVSQEVGTKSNVTCTVYLNNNEPMGQVESHYDATTIANPDSRCFQFDELGLYSAGAPATATNGYSAVNVGESTSETLSRLATSTTYQISVDVDGVTYSAVLTTPAGGTGATGGLTLGDICEGINTGAWIVSGDPIQDHVYVYVTDRSGGTYPTIIGKQSYGFLLFQSRTVGSGSSVNLNCSTASATNFFNVLTNGSCVNVNVNQEAGENAGVANDPTNSANERERLLTHLIFDPILKSTYRSLKIVYVLTVSVPKTTDSQVALVTGA
ncbi:hypothetical protein Xoosp13_299 [Xanthomonas phage Xoo-sp13]|nr:hypothetical protein Xoosp13_299 [Xanthomonas phage Xoo-sp13]